MSALRRYRHPVPARVVVNDGGPATEMSAHADGVLLRLSRADAGPGDGLALHLPAGAAAFKLRFRDAYGLAGDTTYRYDAARGALTRA